MIGTRFGVGVGRRYEPRQYGTFEMSADVSRADVSDKTSE